MHNVKIDVWSDVVCPFCYLGKKKLERAIQKLNLTTQVTVEWHSFQLDPNFPKNIGLAATEQLVKRKGIPLANIQSAQNRLSEQGKEYGIDFQFERAINFNTQNVHRLLHWAKSFGKADELKTELFSVHFTKGLDLSQLENIKQAVVSVDLDAEAAVQVLDSENYLQEFQRDIALARQIGINGVPFFVFNGKTAISGAQADSAFEDVLASLAK